MTEITEQQRHILRHALGLRGSGEQGFTAMQGSPEMDECDALVSLGLMRDHAISAKGDVVFYVTDKGCREVQRESAGAEQPRAPLPPREPTHAMIEAGAQRLVRWEDGCVWPDSWSPAQVVAARNDAERVWRSMYLEWEEQG